MSIPNSRWWGVLALALVAGCRTVREPDPRLERAEALSRAASWTEAAALWTDIYAASGGADIDAGVRAADAMLASGATLSARTLLIDLAARAPRSSAVFDRLGRTHELLGDPVAALSNFRAAVELDPNNAFALGRLGDLAFDVEGAAAGLDALERSVGLDPGAPRGRIRLGLRLLEAGRAERALVFLRGTLDGPHATDEERLDAAAALGPHPAAVPWLREVMRRRPHDAEAQRMYGEALLATGRMAAGLAALEDAARSDPGEVEGLLALVRGLTLAGNEARALAVLEHAAALDLTPGERARVDAARVSVQGAGRAGE